MKKLFYLFLIIGLAVASCNKPEDLPTEKEVSFDISMGGNNFKSGGAPPSFTCNTQDAAYAMITITGINNNLPFRVNVSVIDGKLTTETIKLKDKGSDYTLTAFVLYDSNNVIILATPESGSNYGNWVISPLPQTINIEGFYKTAVPIQVLCYTPTVIEEFGFSWFTFEKINVRELCFFGDICVNASDYVGSIYAGQRNGLQHDMPAIFKVKVYTWNDLTLGWNAPIEKDNSAANWLGEGAPLCIQYPDYDGIDQYKVELLILVKTAPGVFGYQLYKTWNLFDDEKPVLPGTDGVIDFVIGTCTGGDIIFNQTPSDPGEDPITPPVSTGCADCDGKITKLTLKYEGTQINPQIIVKDKKGTVIFTGNVLSGSAFSFQKFPGKKDMGSSIKVYVNGTPTEIHTSCSQTIKVGSVFGPFRVTAGESRNGGPLCAL